MTPLSRFPALKLLLGLWAGISLAFIFSGTALYATVAALLAGLGGWYFRRTVWPLFWTAALACGVWVGMQATFLAIGTPEASVPEMKGIVTGQIEQVLKRDSLATRCLVRGMVDAQALPAQRSVGVVLTVFGAEDSLRGILQPGNRIYAAARLRLPRSAMLPGEMNERLYYSSLDVQWLASAPAPRIALLEKVTSSQTVIENVRSGIADDVQRLFPQDTRGLALALVTGDRTGIDAETRRSFSLAGTAHILSVSGLHVGVIALVLLILLARLRLPWLRFGLYITLLAMYMLLSGAQPSIVRATVMAILVFFASLHQREAHLFNVLCLAVFIMIVVTPQDIFSIGFYLSVASLAGIALVYEPIEAFFHRFIPANRAWQRSVIASLAVSLSASVIVGPLVAWFFSLYSVISPLANLVVVPVTSLGMIYTFCAVLAAQVFEPVGMLFAFSADALFRCAGWATAFAASLPGAAVHGEMALWVSLGMSAATVYVCTARSGRLVGFRVGISAVVMVLAGALLYTTSLPVEIIPRRQVAAVVLPAGPGRRLVMLQDRKPGLYPLGDYGLERYFSAMEDTLTFVTAGPASLFTASRINARNVHAVVTTSLRFKTPKMWPALDTLAKRGVRLVNAQQFLFLARTPALRDSRGRPVVWDVWNNTLVLPGANGGRVLCLPVLTNYETILTEEDV